MRQPKKHPEAGSSGLAGAIGEQLLLRVRQHGRQGESGRFHLAAVGEGGAGERVFRCRGQCQAEDNTVNFPP